MGKRKKNNNASKGLYLSIGFMLSISSENSFVHGTEKIMKKEGKPARIKGERKRKKNGEY